MSDKGPTKTAERFSDGRWTPVADVAEARAMDSAVSLQDGRVLIAGATTHGEVFDPAKGTWARTGGMAAVQPQATAVRRPDGKVLLIGGATSGSAITATEVYDPATNAWQRGPDLLRASGATTAVVLPNGSVLLAGGASGTTPRAGAQILGVPGTPAQHLRKTDTDSTSRSASGLGKVDGDGTARPATDSGSASGWYVALGILVVLAAGAAVLVALRGRGTAAGDPGA
jgi:hypothetical protein